MKRSYIFLGSIVGVTLWFGVALVSPEHSSAATGINPELSFEGKVVTATGINIPDATYNLEFKIYSGGTATGGGTLVWTEDWLVSNSQGVPFTSGTYQVNLGSLCAFSGGSCQGNTNSGVNWESNPLYLSMQIGGTASCTPAGNFKTNCSGDGEMSPYVLLTATPYALNTDELGGLSANAYGQLAANQTWTGANLIQPTTDITGLIVKQSSFATPTSDVFDVQAADGTHIVQVTGTSANNSAVNITTTGTNSITASAGGALTLTAGASSVWSTSTGTLTVESATGSDFTASSQGAGQTNIGTVGTGITAIGNSTGNLELNGPAYTSADSGVLIGNGTATASPVLLGLDNATQQGAENAANCTTTVNAGAIYYSAATASNSTTTNEVRGCINGQWTDIVSGDQLGIMLLGIVEESGTSPGDISGISGYTKSPCKVTWASNTSVTVAPCTAFSGGRKVVITAPVTVATAGTSGSITYQHICLSGTNGSPVATTANTSETAAVPAWSTNAPILCLATVKLSTSQKITNIYDTRIFRASIKEFATSSTAVAPGMLVVNNTATANTVKTIATAATAGVRGIVAVGNSAGSTTAVNVIIVVGGPAFVKATGTITAGFAAETSTTAGYAESVTSASGYKDAGQIFDVGSTSACNAATNCQYSVLIDVAAH